MKAKKRREKKKLQDNQQQPPEEVQALITTETPFHIVKEQTEFIESPQTNEKNNSYCVIS